MTTTVNKVTDVDLEHCDPRSLSALMGLEERQEHRHWRSEELGELLQHQLRAPLLFDLAGVQSIGNITIPKDQSAPGSFEDLFSHPNPPIGLLRLTKEFAKTSDQGADSPLPPEIASVLYCAAIVAARVRCGQSISRLSAGELARCIEWALGQSWVGSPLRELFEQGRASL